MEFLSFKESLRNNEPPRNVSVYLKALWYDARQQWDKAHQLVQDVKDENAAWIHAYLHRKEGDISNADYWYRMADKTRPAVSIKEEWEEIVISLLNK